jgi:hypothetical protein
MAVGIVILAAVIVHHPVFCHFFITLPDRLERVAPADFSNWGEWGLKEYRLVVPVQEFILTVHYTEQ